MPPTDPTDRMNFCLHGDDYMWRKPSESFKPTLAGHDVFGNQVPLARSIPCWAGCSEKGVAVVTFHKHKKLTGPEWAAAVTSGKLASAIKQLDPVDAAGPWHVLCDNEGFLTTAVASAAHRAAKVVLWPIPSRSPDLNPIERFWSHLKKKLRRMDLSDAVSNRPALGKTAYRERVRRVIKSKWAQKIASNCAAGLRRVCKD
eukprot:10919323-Karenia_brevis.AAC.1